MSLTALAETILASAKELDKRGVVDQNSSLGFRNLAPQDYESRSRLISAIQELQRRAYGPAEALHVLYAGISTDIVSYQFVARYNIAAHVPDSGTSFRDVAAKINMDEETLTRLMRHAICNGIFREPESGIVTHSPMSRLWRDDPDYLDMVNFSVEEVRPAADRTLEALEKWPSPREPSHTGFCLANDTSESFFHHLGKDPARVRRMAGMFRAVPQMLVQGSESLWNRPVWKELDKPGTTLVDVGGNRGSISMQLARATKNIRFIVEDRPETVRLGEEDLPAEHRDRISFRVHDFFQKQPVKGAEVYFFRKILHDWPDYACVDILRKTIPALKDGARIIVCDRILPEVATPGYEEREARSSDLLMLLALNGRERTTSDWKKLFAEADPRFDLEFDRWDCSTHGLVKATWKA